MTTIRTTMTDAVESVSMDATVETVRHLFHDLGIHAAVVVDDAGALAGIVSSLDLADELDPDASLRGIASSSVHIVHPDTEVSMAALMMRDFRIHHLVVTVDEEIVGMVSSWDLLESLAATVRAHTLEAVDVAPVAPGDELVVDRPGRPDAERCRIVEVKGAGGLPPYVVRWGGDTDTNPSTIRVVRHNDVALDGCER